MSKKLWIFITIIVLSFVFISGCTNKEATNGTFGEKTVSINNITIVNNVTSEHYEYNGTNYYIIKGYLKNNNNYEVFNLRMKATTYDSEGNIVAVNDTVYLNPKILAVDSETFFGFTFIDNDNRIVRYELKLISTEAKA